MPLHVNGEGLLFSIGDAPSFEVVPSKRVVPLDGGGPFAVCWHYTATTGDAAASLARRIVERPRDLDGDGEPDERAASWHILIARSGRIYQSAPFSVGTWHVGRTREVLGKVRSVNRSTIGIELENAGRLKRFEPGVFAPYPWTRETPKLPPGRATKLEGAWWETFTDAQVLSAEALVRALVEWKPSLASREALSYGHLDFDPGRKEDPGPAWTIEALPGILSRVLGG